MSSSNQLLCFLQTRLSAVHLGQRFFFLPALCSFDRVAPRQELFHAVVEGLQVEGEVLCERLNVSVLQLPEVGQGQRLGAASRAALESPSGGGCRRQTTASSGQAADDEVPILRVGLRLADDLLEMCSRRVQLA